MHPKNVSCLLPELESKCFNRQLANKNIICPKQVQFFLSLVFIEILKFRASLTFPCGFSLCINIKKGAACCINLLDCKSLMCLFITKSHAQLKNQINLVVQVKNSFEMVIISVTKSLYFQISEKCISDLLSLLMRSILASREKKKRHSLSYSIFPPSPAHPPQ